MLRGIGLVGFDAGFKRSVATGLIFVSTACFFLAGAWYTPNDQFALPTNRQAWQFDQCAFTNGYSSPDAANSKASCVEISGKVIEHP